MLNSTPKRGLLADISLLKAKTAQLRPSIAVMVQYDKNPFLVDLNTQLTFSDHFLTQQEKVSTEAEISAAIQKIKKFSEKLDASLDLLFPPQKPKAQGEAILEDYAMNIIHLNELLKKYKVLKNNPLYKGKAPLRNFIHPEDMMDNTMQMLKTVDLDQSSTEKIKTQIITTITSLNYDSQKIQHLSDEIQKTIKGTQDILTSASQKCILTSTSSSSNSGASIVPTQSSQVNNLTKNMLI